LRGGSFSPRPSDGSPTARRLPRTASPVTGRCGPRRIPLPRPAAPRPGRQRRAEHASRRENVTASGPERRALSGLAPPASTVLRIPLRGTRLRRAVDPGDLCQPSGPDGEGQARGQARRARGEPLDDQEAATESRPAQSCANRQPLTGGRLNVSHIPPLRTFFYLVVEPGRRLAQRQQQRPRSSSIPDHHGRMRQAQTWRHQLRRAVPPCSGASALQGHEIAHFMCTNRILEQLNLCGTDVDQRQ
jgi:hypothetical protein